MEKPLAERMRPKKLDEVVGQDKLLGEGKILTELVKTGKPFSLIFWGPPGSGKTTLARIIANEMDADFIELSAVTGPPNQKSCLPKNFQPKALICWPSYPAATPASLLVI
jgi:replication-associated recombination protein RarA